MEYLICPECNRPFNLPVSLRCGHSFCRGCLALQNDRVRGRKRCPICGDTYKNDPQICVVLHKLVELGNVLCQKYRINYTTMSVETYAGQRLLTQQDYAANYAPSFGLRAMQPPGVRGGDHTPYSGAAPSKGVAPQGMAPPGVTAARHGPLECFQRSQFGDGAPPPPRGKPSDPGRGQWSTVIRCSKENIEEKRGEKRAHSAARKAKDVRPRRSSSAATSKLEQALSAHSAGGPRAVVASSHSHGSAGVDSSSHVTVSSALQEDPPGREPFPAVSAPAPVSSFQLTNEMWQACTAPLARRESETLPAGRASMNVSAVSSTSEISPVPPIAGTGADTGASAAAAAGEPGAGAAPDEENPPESTPQAKFVHWASDVVDNSLSVESYAHRYPKERYDLGLLIENSPVDADCDGYDCPPAGQLVAPELNTLSADIYSAYVRQSQAISCDTDAPHSEPCPFKVGDTVCVRNDVDYLSLKSGDKAKVCHVDPDNRSVCVRFRSSTWTCAFDEISMSVSPIQKLGSVRAELFRRAQSAAAEAVK